MGVAQSFYGSVVIRYVTYVLYFFMIMHVCQSLIHTTITRVYNTLL